MIYKDKVHVWNILGEAASCNNRVGELYVLVEAEVTCNGVTGISHTWEAEVCNGVELRVTWWMGVRKGGEGVEEKHRCKACKPPQWWL